MSDRTARRLPLLQLIAVAVLALPPGARADELSGADKLRLVYSTQLAWTRDGLPLVPVRIADGRAEVRLSGRALRILPDGEGGPEVRAGERVTVRVEGGKPARRRWLVVAGRFAPSDDGVDAAIAGLKAHKLTPRTVEVGALLGIKGQVLDGRQLLLVTSAHDDKAAADREAARLQNGGIEATVQPELTERPAGRVVATDERGTVVGNDAILWFAAEGPLEVADIDKEGGGREARRYAGQVYVTLDPRGQLSVVNAVPEDRLLAGLVPAEMPASSPPEALKAQAIAARTTLLARLGTRHPGEPYRLCSTQHCQVYAGMIGEDPRATAAVEATRGELLLRPAGGLVEANYSASCGGHGEDNDKAFLGTGVDPQLRGRPDLDGAEGARFAVVDDRNVEQFLAEAPALRPFCGRSRRAQSSFRWTEPLDPTVLAQKLGVGPLRALEVKGRGVSGRVNRLRVVGDKGERELRGELVIRRALGPGTRTLKSALFVVDSRAEGGHLVELKLRGGGFGHGVGMCQEGAAARAEAGQSGRQILEHYYPGAHVQKMY